MVELLIQLDPARNKVPSDFKFPFEVNYVAFVRKVPIENER